MWDEDDYWELQKKIRLEEDEKKRWAKEVGSSELLRELSENGILEESEKAVTRRKDKPVDYVLTEKLYALRRNVTEIQKEIRTRFQLKERFEKEMDYQIDSASDSLKHLQGGLGYNTGVDMKRHDLEMELIKLRSERRSMAVRCVKDVLGLRRDLREAVREYEALKRMKNAVGNEDAERD